MNKKLWRPTMPKDFSWRIKYHRERQWWQIKEFAEYAWINPVTYFKIENNPEANPTIMNVVRISRALGVKVEDLTRHSFWDNESDNKEEK